MIRFCTCVFGCFFCRPGVRARAIFARLDEELFFRDRREDRRRAREASFAALLEARVRERWPTPVRRLPGAAPRSPIPRRHALVARHRSRQVRLYGGAPRG